MVEAIHRIWLMFTDGARPIDWAILLVDAFVFGVIIIFEAPEYFHKRRVKKIMLRFQPLIEEGENLQRDIPRPAYGSSAAGSASFIEAQEKEVAWMKSVQAWSTGVSTFASGYPIALAVFRHETNPKYPEPLVIYKPEGAFQVSGTQKVAYLRLGAELRNLCRIAEKPEAYF